MSCNQNGIIVYEPDEQPDIKLPKDVKVISHFGFKVSNKNGEKVLIPGTEDDYRFAESKRLGILPSEVDISITDTCFDRSPGGGPGHFPRCEGDCGHLSCVTKMLPPDYYYCGCQKCEKP